MCNDFKEELTVHIIVHLFIHDCFKHFQLLDIIAKDQTVEKVLLLVLQNFVIEEKASCHLPSLLENLVIACLLLFMIKCEHDYFDNSLFLQYLIIGQTHKTT